MRYRIRKNFPQTSFWLCTFEIFLFPKYTCVPYLRHLIWILSGTTLDPDRREPALYRATSCSPSFPDALHRARSLWDHDLYTQRPCLPLLDLAPGIWVPRISCSNKTYLGLFFCLSSHGQTVLPVRTCLGQPQSYGQSPCKWETLRLKPLR